MEEGGCLKGWRKGEMFEMVEEGGNVSKGGENVECVKGWGKGGV